MEEQEKKTLESRERDVRVDAVCVHGVGERENYRSKEKKRGE